MANSTVRTAKHIHGTNPQFLIEKVIRSRIYDSPYWKEQCFALTAESFVDRTLELNYIGGTFGLQRPSPFLCLVCKLLQIQPDKEIILEYLRYAEFKYLRAVAAMYVRLTCRAIEVYEILEPMLNDYRKLRYRQTGGQYTITYMDEYIDSLLTQERVCELILPRLIRRDVLEETEGLAPRVSKLEDALLLTGDASNADEGQESDASDDSTRAERRERLRRIERAQRIRKEREEEEDRKAQILLGSRSKESSAELVDEQDVNEELAYPSQEESDGERYVSRSPSRNGSGSGGYQSRSPSRSSDRQSSGYRSRSVSRSPDRT